MQIKIEKAIITRCEIGNKNPAWAFVDVLEIGGGMCSFKVATQEAGLIQANMGGTVGLLLEVSAQKFGRDLALTITKVGQIKPYEVKPAANGVPA